MGGADHCHTKTIASCVSVQNDKEMGINSSIPQGEVGTFSDFVIFLQSTNIFSTGNSYIITDYMFVCRSSTEDCDDWENWSREERRW